MTWVDCLKKQFNDGLADFGRDLRKKLFWVVFLALLTAMGTVTYFCRDYFKDLPLGLTVSIIFILVICIATVGLGFSAVISAFVSSRRRKNGSSIFPDNPVVMRCDVIDCTQDKDIATLIGTWHYSIGRSTAERTFKDDHSVSSTRGERHGTWTMEDTVIRMQWPKDRWETLQRPIDPSGTRGESWTKKSVWAKKKDPSLLPYNPAIMQALQDRVSTPKYRDELGRAKYPLEETLGKLWEGWKQYSRFGELYYSRERLNQFSEWPAIQELSCRLFDHKAFTSETWERLESWLLTEHLNGDREEFHVIPRKVVVRLLREAVSPKAQ